MNTQYPTPRTCEGTRDMAKRISECLCSLSGADSVCNTRIWNTDICSGFVSAKWSCEMGFWAVLMSCHMEDAYPWLKWYIFPVSTHSSSCVPFQHFKFFFLIERDQSQKFPNSGNWVLLRFWLFLPLPDDVSELQPCWLPWSYPRLNQSLPDLQRQHCTACWHLIMLGNESHIWVRPTSASLLHCKQLDSTVMDKALSATNAFTFTVLICNVHSDGLL